MPRIFLNILCGQLLLIIFVFLVKYIAMTPQFLYFAAAGIFSGVGSLGSYLYALWEELPTPDAFWALLVIASVLFFTAMIHYRPSINSRKH